MPDVTPFPEWVFCVNIPNMVQLAQKWRTTMKNPMKNNIRDPIQVATETCGVQITPKATFAILSKF